jgi:hypothetical protein
MDNLINDGSIASMLNDGFTNYNPPYIFRSVEDYRRFFNEFGVTNQDLKECKLNGGWIEKHSDSSDNVVIKYFYFNGEDNEDMLPVFNIGSDVFSIGVAPLQDELDSGFFVVNGGVRDQDTEIPFNRMYFRLTKFELVPYNQRQGGKTMRRRRKSKKIKKTRKSIKKIKKGGNKMKCCMCGKKVDKENSMTPSICYKQKLDKAHRICSDCWWEDFSKENRPNHNCPGCTNNMPLTKVTYDSSETIDLTK